jgi:hypothetical protein
MKYKAMYNERYFDFAISFAGNERTLGERLASLLNARGAAVFIDSFYRSHLLGKRLDRKFKWVFGPGTKYFVPLVSQSYADRSWPQYEWDVAIREAQKRDPQEFILPLRIDDAILVGLPSTVRYIDLRKHSINEVADLLIDKLKGTMGTDVTHWVATFGLLIEAVLESGKLPTTAPRFYPHLCDWLAEDLLTRLRSSSISNVRITEDSRNGETFSLRIEFKWKSKEEPLDFGKLDWWEVLEVLPYDRVYHDD